jgi:hypothetical protein
LIKLCVTGGRDFNDNEFVIKVLSKIKRNDIILAHGNATGVDALCAEYARQRGWKVLPYPANWKLYKNAAGGIRNSYMLQDFKPDYLIVFPGGKGTRDCLNKAINLNIKVFYATILAKD